LKAVNKVETARKAKWTASKAKLAKHLAATYVSMSVVADLVKKTGTYQEHWLSVNETKRVPDECS
jgi:hypothetical protein